MRNPFYFAGGGVSAVSSVNGEVGVVVLSAGDIPNTPAGGIAATDVQTALNELDTEKLPTVSPVATVGYRVIGNNSYFEAINAALTANYSFGLDGNDLAIRAGVPSGGDVPLLTFSRATQQVAFGGTTADFTTATWTFIDDAGFGNRDHVLNFQRDGGTEGLFRFWHWRPSGGAPHPYLATVGVVGSRASPSAPLSGYLLGGYGMRSYDGSAIDWFQGIAGYTDDLAATQAYATQNLSGTAHGARLFLFGTANGATVPGAGVNVQDGVYSPGATGGDQGANTLNFSTLFEAGVSLVSKYGQLSVQNIWSANNFFTSGFEIQSSASGSSFGPSFTVRRAANRAVNDGGPQMTFFIQDASGNAVSVLRQDSVAEGVTAGSVSGRVDFLIRRAGTLQQLLSMGDGAIFGSPTGSFQGLGTVNATAVYDDSVLLTCMPFNPDMDQAAWDAMTVGARHEDYDHIEIVETETLVQNPLERALKWATLGAVKLGKVEVTKVERAETRKRIVNEVGKRENITAKRHFRMQREGFDATDPENYIARLTNDKALPGLLTKSEWLARMIDNGPVDKVSHAEFNERQVLAMDYLAQFAISSYNYAKSLEARIAALEAKK